METTAASNVGINEKAGALNKDKYNNILASIEVLNKENWTGKEHEAFYGESDIQLLCEKMSIDARNCILAFREFRDSSQSTPTPAMPHTLRQLFNAVDTYVVSTAECERSFSVMNDILTPTRNSLTIDYLSKLVFVKCAVGPPLSKFQPSDYVTSWIKKGHRSADETNYPARSHARACIP